MQNARQRQDQKRRAAVTQSLQDAGVGVIAELRQKAQIIHTHIGLCQIKIIGLDFQQMQERSGGKNAEDHQRQGDDHQKRVHR